MTFNKACGKDDKDGKAFCCCQCTHGGISAHTQAYIFFQIVEAEFVRRILFQRITAEDRTVTNAI